MAIRATKSARKPRGRGFERRQEILLAAELLFEKQGLDAPLRDIATAAGLSQASLFKHFATRADLTSAVRHNVYARLEEDIREDHSPPEDIRGHLDAIFRAHARLAKDRPAIFSLAFPSAGQLAQLDPKLLDEASPPLPGLRTLRAALRSGSGSRLPSLELMTLSSWFMIYGMALTVAVEFGRDRLKAEETITAFLDLLTSQLAGLG